MSCETDNRLQEGDAFEVLESLPEDYAQAAMVDYPWQFDTSNNTNRFGQGDASDGDSQIYYMEAHERLPELCEQLSRVLEQGSWCFFFADDSVYPELREAVEECPELERRQTVYWDTVHFGMGYYHRVQVYPIVAATVGKTKRYVQGRGTIYRVAQKGSTTEYHTEKPAELYQEILSEPVLESGERLLEPFSGTAPGARAALELEADSLSVERSEEALRIARERLETAREEISPTEGQIGLQEYEQ